MTVLDYFFLESVMEAWYLSGKLDATTAAASPFSGDMTHHCKTVNVD